MNVTYNISLGGCLIISLHIFKNQWFNNVWNSEISANCMIRISLLSLTVTCSKSVKNKSSKNSWYILLTTCKTYKQYIGIRKNFVEECINLADNRFLTLIYCDEDKRGLCGLYEFIVWQQWRIFCSCVRYCEWAVRNDYFTHYRNI